MKRSSALSAILIGGSIAGAADITYAIVFWALRAGVLPARVLQSVASGALGAAAFKGGLPAAALGLGLHFLIAFSAATIFWFASRRFPALLRHAVVSGIAYGVLIYAVMNLIVVPLSAVPRQQTFPPLVLVTGLLVHMFGVGLPIALAARRAATRASS